MIQQIDLHTHQVKSTGNIQIRNVFAQDLTDQEPDFLYSAGLHPWNIAKVDMEQCLRAIDSAAIQKNMLAIGECGLDRSVAIDFALQEWCFRQQIQLAENHHKPLIIHCVRAFSDLIRHKKESKSNLPWIIHGYRGNLETALSLIKHEFYFSVGEKLLKDETKLDVFRAIPVDRLFLETDESETSITEIYSLAAQIVMIEVQELSQIITQNFNTVFRDHMLSI